MHGRTPRSEDPVGDSPAPAEILKRLGAVDLPEALRDPVEDAELEHREFESGEFWRGIPAFARVDHATFCDPRFQNMHTVTRPEQLREILSGHVREAFLADVEEGLRLAPMALRLSPYLLSLVDWERPYEDPIRRQFLPVASTRLPDHPMLTLDSLAEQDDSPVPGLVHRYPDKALFLALDACPVYCRFCTRSYAIGQDTEAVEKVDYKAQPKRWERAFAYMASRPELEDVVVSGGDVYNLAPRRLEEIGRTLLAIPHIRRVRFATKGPAVMPMKILGDHAWVDALTRVVDLGRRMGKEVAVHTHFNSPSEITEITRQAMGKLFSRGIKVRNQAVLIRGVNDTAELMTLLVRRLAYMNVQPYYVYQHDLVQGVETLRTRVAETLEIERAVRGSTAGFNTPIFVVDAPGGGGKRDAHSFDYYDETTGVSVYRSPTVDADRAYLYFDPLALLPEEGQARWADPDEHESIVEEALQACGHENLELAVAPDGGERGA